MSFVQELKRRNVFRVGIAYAIAAWLLLQIIDVVVLGAIIVGEQQIRRRSLFRLAKVASEGSL